MYVVDQNIPPESAADVHKGPEATIVMGSDGGDVVGCVGGKAAGGSKPSKDKPAMKCYNCTSTGHIALHCPKPPTRVCHACGDEGHVRAVCPYTFAAAAPWQGAAAYPAGMEQHYPQPTGFSYVVPVIDGGVLNDSTTVTQTLSPPFPSVGNGQYWSMPSPHPHNLANRQQGVKVGYKHTPLLQGSLPGAANLNQHAPTMAEKYMPTGHQQQQQPVVATYAANVHPIMQQHHLPTAYVQWIGPAAQVSTQPAAPFHILAPVAPMQQHCGPNPVEPNGVFAAHASSDGAAAAAGVHVHGVTVPSSTQHNQQGTGQQPLQQTLMQQPPSAMPQPMARTQQGPQHHHHQQQQQVLNMNAAVPPAMTLMPAAEVSAANCNWVGGVPVAAMPGYSGSSSSSTSQNQTPSDVYIPTAHDYMAM